MNKKFLFNKVVGFLLRPDFPDNAEDGAIALYSAACNGNHHYIRLVPCKRYGLFPEVGTVTVAELAKIDSKFLKKQNEKAKELLTKLGLDKAHLDKGPTDSYHDEEDDDDNNGRLLN